MAEPDSAPKPDPNNLPPFWRSLYATLERVPRVGLISIVGPVFLLVTSYVLWVYYGAPHLNRSQYGLRQENLIVTPQPAWIRSNVTEQVFQGSQLGQLSTLDRQLAPVVYNAFRAHPWIRRVFDVKKFAGEVKVLVEYRMPIAMVYEESSSGLEVASHTSTPHAPLASAQFASTIESESPAGKKPAHFLPVDVDGILLPTKDFPPDQIPNYFLIYAQGASRSGNKAGTEYGDTGVRDALRLCRELREDREPLGLEKIYVYRISNGTGQLLSQLEVTTKSGKRILWGHPPGAEEAGEPGALAKLRKLREILTNPNSPEALSNEIDLIEKAKVNLKNAFLGGGINR